MSAKDGVGFAGVEACWGVGGGLMLARS
jgi:hypothetical protein